MRQTDRQTDRETDRNGDLPQEIFRRGVKDVLANEGINNHSLGQRSNVLYRPLGVFTKFKSPSRPFFFKYSLCTQFRFGVVMNNGSGFRDLLSLSIFVH